MEFLKEILGEELYSQVASKVNEHNGNEANKENQVKLANLAKGEYVSKGKFDSLQDSLNGKTSELTSAQELIKELKAGTSNNDALQQSIADYEARNEKLQKELAETQLKSALKIALLSEKALDVDYLTYKLEQADSKLELDDNGGIKGWADMVTGLKTSYPSMFENADGSQAGFKPIETNGLPKGGKDDGITKADIMKMSYQERANLARENPEAYNSAMGR